MEDINIHEEIKPLFDKLRNQNKSFEEIIGIIAFAIQDLAMSEFTEKINN